MKKLVVFGGFILNVFLALTPNSGWAGCNSPVTLGFDGNQSPTDDEFLYENEKEFALTQSGFINSGKQNSGDGRGYECDEFNSPSCAIDDEIEMPVGHVFEGEVIKQKRRYKCVVGLFGDDKWEIVDDGFCSTKAFGDIAVGSCVEEGSSCKNLTDIDCSGYNKTDSNGTIFYGICLDGPKFICKAVECKDGFFANDDGICVPKQQNNDNEKDDNDDGNGDDGDNDNEGDDGNGGDDGNSNYSCLQRCINLTGSQKAECAACCVVPASLAKWENGVCKCQQNPNQKFNISELKCEDVVAQPEINDPNACDPEQLAQIMQWKIKYSSNAEISTLIDVVIQYCNGNSKNKEVFNAYFLNIQITINELEEGKKVSSEMNASKTKISAAVEEMDTISAGFDDSVWKNEEGKFNTSRLISDSVAGVVLGTAGGLITSSVLKKNQVEDGFENIQCTIGGQVVAGWGDQFVVGR